MMSERSSQPGEPTPFDRAIRRTLQADLETASPSACLDAETIAAWADGTLGRDDRATAERHAAACARCQAILAAVAATEPPGSRSGLAVWLRLPALKWLAPAAALATALLVWAVLPNRVIVQHEPAVDTVADNQPRDVPIAPQMATPPADNVPERGPASEERAGAQAGARQLRKSTEPPAGVEPSPQAAPSAETDTGATASAAAAAGRVSALREQAASADASAPPTSGFAPAKPAAPAATPLPAAGASLSANAAAPAQLAAKALRSEAATVPQVTIVSSNPASRWRTLPGGAVQRSMDGGSTWQLQQTGVPVTLVAGTSPSPSVCWLVGPSGTIVLTTDGRAWRRVAFPETADLVAIRVTDEGVTVTSSDGRAFTSDDGGTTWTRE